MKQAQVEALYQSEILFYRAEMLRREFDALDNTLALWLGPKDGIRGQITARISDNPQYVRLALDPQINLFAWLDRDIESQRDDISTLRTHWEEVYELSRQVCLAVGCAEGSQNLPDVQTTAVLQLSKVVSPAVWQAFQEWQKSGGHESFSFWILLRPSTGIISTKHENARIVDLRLAAQRNGAEETLHSFDLYHPGVSYIPYRGTIHVDVLKPDHISSALRPSTLGDTTIRNLKEAWIAKDAPPPASRFAGYGMFTEWRLTLEPDQLNKSLNEVVLQIAYRYTPAQADATSEAGESFILRPVGTDLTIEGSTLNALGGQKQLQDKLLRWRSSRETNIPPLSFAAEIEGHQ